MTRPGGDLADYAVHLKNALAHLHEPDTLGLNPLAAILTKAPDTVSRGLQLHDLLLELIDSLRPATPHSDHAPEWRLHLLLSERYVQRRSLTDIEARLALGDRQVRREHQRALNALGARLEARLQAALAPPEAAVPSTVQEAVQRLSPVARVFGLAALFDDVVGLTIAANHLAADGIAWRVDPPDLTVVTDWGILHQLLLKLLKLFVPKGQPQPGISIMARRQPGGAQVSISLGGNQVAGGAESEEFEICRLIAQSLPAVLRWESGASPQLWFNLPIGTRLRKVFVIDDEPLAIELIRGYLAGLDFEVRGEANPERAVESAIGFKPDVLVLDVMMPAVDGWAILQRLRHTPEMADVPIVVYSVLDEQELAAALGATRFMRKPVLRQQWLELFEDLRGLQP